MPTHHSGGFSIVFCVWLQYVANSSLDFWTFSEFFFFWIFLTPPLSRDSSEVQAASAAPACMSPFPPPVYTPSDVSMWISQTCLCIVQESSGGWVDSAMASLSSFQSSSTLSHFMYYDLWFQNIIGFAAEKQRKVRSRENTYCAHSFLRRVAWPFYFFPLFYMFYHLYLTFYFSLSVFI